jgi:hypothetical protein
VAEEKGAAPPDGGRMNHEAMRRASELPVAGPAATKTLAASSGLELPGRIEEAVSDDELLADRAEADRRKPPTAASIEKIERLPRKEEH